MRHAKGTKVMVDNSTDNTMDMEYIGMVGVVSSYNENGLTGNTATDPLHNVTFDNGNFSGMGFWYEELKEIK